MEYILVVQIASHKSSDIVRFCIFSYYGRFLVGQIPLVSLGLFFNGIKPSFVLAKLLPSALA